MGDVHVRDGEGGDHRVWRTRDLRASGMSTRDIRSAVDGGLLQKACQGAYLARGAPDEHVRAVARGGRLTCVSLLRLKGVFVARAGGLHTHLAATATQPAVDPGDAVHRQRLLRPVHRRASEVSVLDALHHATLCQEEPDAVASIDSALNKRLVSHRDVDELFQVLPARLKRARRLVDARAEAGPETLVRLMAVALGFCVQSQVLIPGVGRVDLLLDGWIIVECDSREFHADWERQRRDHRRDQAAAARGYARYRPIAEDILFHPDAVAAALRGLRELTPRVPRTRPV